MNILFQKFVKLAKSRWTATKDRIVNIPIFDKDILNTIESFPRTPEEAGIIPVKLKHMQKKVAWERTVMKLRKTYQIVKRKKKRML